MWTVPRSAPIWFAGRGVSSALAVPAAARSAGRAASSPVHGFDPRRVFPARIMRTTGVREGLPCPVRRDPCPTGRTSAISSWRPNAASRRVSSPRCMKPRPPSPASTAWPAGPPSSSRSRRGRTLTRWASCAGSCPGSPGPGSRAGRAPADDELRQHFSDRFLNVLPPATLVSRISQLASELRGGEFVVLRQTPLQAYVELNGVQYIAAVEAEPPHRLTGLRAMPTGSRVRDPRIANPPVSTEGDVPGQVPRIAAEALAELGLPALTIAGGDRDATRPWVLATGWADLDCGEALDPGHRFPAPGVTMLVTATAVLRLVADGRDRPGQPGQRPPALRPPGRRHHHRPGTAQPHRRGRQPRPRADVRRHRPGAGRADGPGHRLLRPARGAAAQQRRLRRARPAGRRPYRAALLRRRHAAGARPAAPHRLVVSRPPGRHRPRGGHRLQPHARRHVPARPGPDPDSPGGRRAVVDGGRSRAPGPAVVLAAAAGPRARGAHRPGRPGPTAPGPVSAGSSSPPASSPCTPALASKPSRS